MRLMSLRQVLNSALSSQRPPHLSLANNTFTLVTDAENKKVVSGIEDGVIFVDVHFVDANVALSKVYYKEKFSNKEEDQVAPTCFSDDSISPSDQSQEKQSEFCAQCQWNVWGTAQTDTGNKGKACRDMHKTAVVVPSFSAEAIFQLRIPPASLKAWNAYVSSFAEFKIQGREGTVGDVITRVYFEPGKQGIINFGPIREVSAEERNYLEHVNEANLAITHIGFSGEMPALPAPQARKQIQAPKKTEFDDSALADQAIAQKQAEDQARRDRELVAQKKALQEEGDRLAAEALNKPAKPSFMKGIGQPVATKKPVVPAKTPGVVQKSFMKLDPGMRTKPTVKPDAVEAEVIEEQPAKMLKPSSVGNGSPVEGIPGTQMPSELSSMLKGLMDL